MKDWQRDNSLRACTAKQWEEILGAWQVKFRGFDARAFLKTVCCNGQSRSTLSGFNAQDCVQDGRLAANIYSLRFLMV